MLPNGSIIGVINLYYRRLLELREDNDYKIKDVAEFLEMHRGVYSRYEDGEREIPAWALSKLSEFYNVSVDYILGLTDKKDRNA